MDIVARRPATVMLSLIGKVGRMRVRAMTIDATTAIAPKMTARDIGDMMMTSGMMIIGAAAGVTTVMPRNIAAVSVTTRIGVTRPSRIARTDAMAAAGPAIAIAIATKTEAGMATAGGATGLDLHARRG